MDLARLLLLELLLLQTMGEGTTGVVGTGWEIRNISLDQHVGTGSQQPGEYIDRDQQQGQSIETLTFI